MADNAGLAPPDHTYMGEGEIPLDARIVAIHPSVEEIPDNLFMDCDRLEVVRFHNDGGLLRIGRNAFMCCPSLRDFPCPPTVMEIGVAAFTRCFSLADFKMPEGLASIEARTFTGCHSLKELRIPPSVAQIGQGAFFGCINLASIEIPGGLRRIANGAFRDCRALGSVCFPSSIEDVGNYAFEGCTNLTLIGLPEGLQRIGNGAVRDCRSLGNVHIPSTVEHVGDYAFAACSNLALVRLHEDLRTLGRSAFQGCPMVTFRFVRLSERTKSIALDEWASSEVEGSLNEASDALVGESPNTWEQCQESLRRAHAVLTHQLEEVTTTLELSLWKKKISEEERRGPRPLRQEYRVNCGADMNIAIREVLGFIPPPWP